MKTLNQNKMKELKKQHLEMLQLLESIEVMLQNGDSIHPNSVIRGAIQTAIGMDINLNNMKQTAVEWLVEQITNKVGYYSEEVQQEIYQQAKAMEKEQIIDAFDYGDSNLFIDKDGDKYYNETFKNQ